jgi:hypothetical protein
VGGGDVVADLFGVVRGNHMGGAVMNLWLDDIRNPVRHGCYGWQWVKTAAEAIAALKTGAVDECSLDHDLGACADCFRSAGVEHTGDYAADWAAWVCAHAGQAAPNCPHVGTGYDVVCWMEEHGIWPKTKPRVHSANPVGAARMRQAIDRIWR